MRNLPVLLFCAALLPALAHAAGTPRVENGRRLAAKFCSACHAIGRSGASPHPAAPAFRLLDRRVDLDSVRERLQSGLFAGHADMPQFRLTRRDARAMQAYLQSIQSP